MKITFNTLLNILLAGMIALFIGRYFYQQPRFVNGESAPDFAAATLSGEQLQLSSLRGHYVLIDFWGSWCGPCRKEHPALVQLYDKYQNAVFQQAEGFKLVSIGIEENEDRWRRAIERDGLHWPYHILDKASSLRFFDSELARQFGVKQVPTRYLLNAKGQIIAVNPSVEELDRLLGEKIL
ncbi:MAG: TlpA family protein disulfide reductase [Lewinellaceae bacterium]|nr:TlpA family protein disulfide reductase [Phaeodactylibacter sp.]MCB9040014.1 TlpA family protein disulfide reductase [Lewinellaceae bacterium]